MLMIICQFFSNKTYRINLKENNNLNSVILTVNATDRDVGANSRISYKVSDDAKNTVSVDSSSGVIKATGVFDYEFMRNYRFTVTAQDAGVPSLTSTATVIIDIIDMNDEAPIFSEKVYNFNVRENQPAGTQVSTVSAMDLDGSPYNKVAYSLHAPVGTMELFDIDSITGVITTRAVLDREDNSAYALKILAGNPGYDRLTSTVSATVYVLDENDNSPIILYPNKNNNTIQIPRDLRVGYVISRVIARDNDNGDNGKLIYSISNGNKGSYFDMDPSNGALLIKSSMDNVFDNTNFQLIIKVSDSGLFPQSSTEEFSVYVNYSAIWKDTHALKATSDSFVGSYHQTVVFSLGGATIFLIIILIASIICLRRRANRGKREEYRYMCQVDLAAQRSLGGKECQETECYPVEPERKTFLNRDVIPQIEDEIKRKEVRFCMDTDSHQLPTPPLSNHSSPVKWKDMPKESQVPVHQILHMGVRDPNNLDSDSTSGCSADMSNTDSGKGPSEDGDGQLLNNLNPPIRTHESLHDASQPKQQNGDMVWELRDEKADIKIPQVPLPPRPAVQSAYCRGKVAPHRNVASPQLAYGRTVSRTCPRSRAAPYSNVPTPHRLIDPHEDHINETNLSPSRVNSLKKTLNNDTLSKSVNSLNNNSSLGNSSPKKPIAQIASPHLKSNTLPYIHSTSKYNANNRILPHSHNRTKNSDKPYTNSFGRHFPLDRLDENSAEMSDDSGTTTSGSYDIDRSHNTAITCMNTIV